MHDLFAAKPDPAANVLPGDGIVNDHGRLSTTDEADAWLSILLADVPWRRDEAMIRGRRIRTARQVAWYGDAAFDYRYSGVTRTALPWHPALLAIKARVEAAIAAISPTVFNACLLNLYADGRQGMAWHSDDERELGQNTVIASVSLGATRKFVLRHKRSRQQRALLLDHGRLIVMRGATQAHWQHALMTSARIHEPRINLTFRTLRPRG